VIHFRREFQGRGCGRLIDRNGINATRYGALPAQMAAICRSNMAFFDLSATACIARSKEAAVHALLLCPLTAAVLSPREIRKMTYEMFDAEREFLPEYKMGRGDI
jgi:alpha-galactosidase